MLRIPVSPLAQDVRQGAHSFGIVNVGGLAPQPFHRRERGPGPGHAPLALNGGDEGGLFPADEGPRPFPNPDAEAEV